MHTGMAWAELKKKSDSDLVALHDECARGTGEFLLTLRDELRHRDSARQTKTMVRLSREMVAMTVLILLATIANVVLWTLG